MNDSDDEHRRMGQRRSLGGAAASRARPDYQPRHHRSFRRSVAARATPVPWRHGAEQAAFPRSHPVSEDIDLVRTTAGPIGPILDRVRERLEPWLGRGNFEQSQVAPKLRFRAQAEDPTAQIRLKVEINTWEIEAYDAPQAISFRVDNPWFAGNAEIPTFSREEMLATKLCALLQRNKGRDLFDLAHSPDVFEGLNAVRVVECFGRYLQRSEMRISRAEAEQRMFAKLNTPASLPICAPCSRSAAD
jgi:predicted nucleotidyltransferase component of viral defense system